jgi:RNA polymerase sigma factor (sigma-70 family)
VNRKNLQHIHSFKPFLLVSGRNHTLNNLRSIFRSEAATSEVIHSFERKRNNSEENLLSKDYHSFLQTILGTLPARSREILRQCRQQGRTNEEVVTDLGISKNAVKNHLV